MPKQKQHSKMTQQQKTRVFHWIKTYSVNLASTPLVDQPIALFLSYLLVLKTKIQLLGWKRVMGQRGAWFLGTGLMCPPMHYKVYPSTPQGKILHNPDLLYWTHQNSQSLSHMPCALSLFLKLSASPLPNLPLDNLLSGKVWQYSSHWSPWILSDITFANISSFDWFFQSIQASLACTWYSTHCYCSNT